MFGKQAYLIVFLHCSESRELIFYPYVFYQFSRFIVMEPTSETVDNERVLSIPLEDDGYVLILAKTLSIVVLRLVRFFMLSSRIFSNFYFNG